MHDLTRQIHAELVGIPSVSHHEGPIADFVEARLRTTRANVERIENNIVAWRGDPPRLLFNSHLDTVPATEAWTRDPNRVEEIDGRIYGLGANDAKGAVAAMIAAFETFHRDGLGLLLVQEEETGGRGAESVWPMLQTDWGWSPQAVVVGEPTDLQIGITQDGMMVIEMIAEGDACHAAHAEALGARNPAHALARDIVTLVSLDLPVQPQVTMISASAARNQVGNQARAVVDLRTRPGMDHNSIAHQIQSAMNSNVDVRSIRLQPYACDPNAPIVACIQSVSPRSQPFHSRTMSDQVHFQGVHAVKFGPGRTERSHTADEFILASELNEGADAYLAIAEAYLR